MIIEINRLSVIQFNSKIIFCFDEPVEKIIKIIQYTSVKVEAKQCRPVQLRSCNMKINETSYIVEKKEFKTMVQPMQCMSIISIAYLTFLHSEPVCLYFPQFNHLFR